MPQNIFISGPPKSGKTTLLMKAIDELRNQGFVVGGFFTPEEKHHGTRTGFFVVDIVSGKKAILADLHNDGPKVSKYHVDVKSFESVAVPALESVDNYDLLIIDEISWMELKSSRFPGLLDRVFASKTPVVATMNADYLEKYAPYGDVIYTTGTNHGIAYDELMEKLDQMLAKGKTKQAMPMEQTTPEKKPKKTVTPTPTPASKPKKGKVAQPLKPVGKQTRLEAEVKSEPKVEPRKETKPETKPAPKTEKAAPKKEEKKKRSFVEKLKDLLGF